MARMAREDQAPAALAAPPAWRGPSEIELLAALYADPEVRQVLGRHGVPVRSLAGPAWQRLPAPRPLTADLVGDLYEGCGLSLHLIELLTGRPAAAVGAVLRVSGIKLRPSVGRSPFMDRWRPGRESGAPRTTAESRQLLTLRSSGSRPLLHQDQSPLTPTG
jgi:hypothetical protein